PRGGDLMPKKFTFVVLTNPVAGKEDEYNEWYSKQHIHDVVRAPQISAARRFQIAPMSQKAGDKLGFKYVALYECEANEAPEIAAGIGALRDEGRMPVSDALDRDTTRAVYFEEMASTGFVEDAHAGATPGVLIVLANAAEGRDADLMDWYGNRHIH